MEKRLLILIALALSLSQFVFGQDNNVTTQLSETKVFDVVDEMPSFVGGIITRKSFDPKTQGYTTVEDSVSSGPQGLFEYLAKSIKYPIVAEENGVQGRVIVTFVVERDGSITEVKVLKSVDPSLDKEAQRVVKSMPKWEPGKLKGSAVRVKYTVPVTFRLQ